MFEASPACLPNPFFTFFKEACTEIIQGPLAAAMITSPQQSAEKTSGPQIGLDIEYIKKNDKDPQRKISHPICYGIMFSLFLLLWGRVCHSP
jgi:hypothetical protein